jgi:hypothetical protein
MRAVFVDANSAPATLARACRALRHVVFLGTGARTYMSPEALAELGIAVHTITFRASASRGCARAQSSSTPRAGRSSTRKR